MKIKVPEDKIARLTQKRSHVYDRKRCLQSDLRCLCFRTNAQELFDTRILLDAVEECNQEASIWFFIVYHLKPFQLQHVASSYCLTNLTNPER